MEALTWFTGTLTLGAWAVTRFSVGSEAAGLTALGTNAGRFAAFPPVLGELCCPDFPCPPVDESATVARARFSPGLVPKALPG